MPQNSHEMRKLSAPVWGPERERPSNLMGRMCIRPFQLQVAESVENTDASEEEPVDEQASMAVLLAENSQGKSCE